MEHLPDCEFNPAKRLETIDNYLLTRREVGMLSFDESIRQLILDGNITKEVAEQHVRDLSILKR